MMIIAIQGPCGALKIFQLLRYLFYSQPVIWVCLAGAGRAVTDIPMANYWRCGQVKRSVSAALQARTHTHAGLHTDKGGHHRPGPGYIVIFLLCSARYQFLGTYFNVTPYLRTASEQQQPTVFIMSVA